MTRICVFVLQSLALATGEQHGSGTSNVRTKKLNKSINRPATVSSVCGAVFCLCVQCKFNTLGLVVQILRKAGTSSKVNRYNKPTKKSFAYTQTIVRLYPNDYSPIRKRLFAYRQIYCVNSDVFFYRYLLVRLM